MRSAIVTDLDWMARATRLFAWMIPGQARVFEIARSSRRSSGWPVMPRRTVVILASLLAALPVACGESEEEEKAQDSVCVVIAVGGLPREGHHVPELS